MNPGNMDATGVHHYYVVKNIKDIKNIKNVKNIKNGLLRFYFSTTLEIKKVLFLCVAGIECSLQARGNVTPAWTRISLAGWAVTRNAAVGGATAASGERQLIRPDHPLPLVALTWKVVNEM